MVSPRGVLDLESTRRSLVSASGENFEVDVNQNQKPFTPTTFSGSPALLAVESNINCAHFCRRAILLANSRMEMPTPEQIFVGPVCFWDKS